MGLVFSASLQKGASPNGKPFPRHILLSMNKKKNPDLVRNINYLVRLNKVENDLFLNRLKEANDMKPISFLRELIKKTIIIAPLKKEELVANERLLSILIEYRNNFKRLSNLIKAHDPSLNFQIELLVKAMQKKIDGI